MKYFSINELCRSDSAVRLGIENTPNEVETQHLVETIENCLDPLREAWGAPIHINSGFRSPNLNKVVGGSATSSHTSGYAVDMAPVPSTRLAEFKKFCIEYFRNNVFDQLISENENEKGVPQWMHLGWKRSDGSQRRQMLKMVGNKYYML